MCNFRIDDLFENFYDIFIIYNYLNTFFARYIFYIIIIIFVIIITLFFRLKERVMNLLKVL